MKKIFAIVTLSMMLGTQIAFAAFDSASWPYMRSLDLEPLTEKKIVSVNLDNDLTTQAFQNFRDLRLVSSSGKETNYSLSESAQKDAMIGAKITEIKVDDTVLTDENLQTWNISDDNRKSYLELKGSKVSLTVELAEAQNIDKVNSFTYDAANTWTSIEVNASEDGKTWKTVRPGIDSPHQIWRWVTLLTGGKSYKYYQMNFSPSGNLKLHELQLFTANGTTLSFEAEANEKYTLYYGNMNAETPEYASISNEGAENIALLAQGRNPAWNGNNDNDGVSYGADNCPFDANPDQKDEDLDGLGDICDKGAPIMKTQKNTEKKDMVNEEKKADENTPTSKPLVTPAANTETESPTQVSESILYAVSFFIVGLVIGLWVSGGSSEKKSANTSSTKKK